MLGIFYTGSDATAPQEVGGGVLEVVGPHDDGEP